MSLWCRWHEARLSRLIDGELTLQDYRATQAHLEVCGRCADRVAAFRALDEALDGSPPVVAHRPEPRAAVLAAALAAALIASLAATLMLPAATPEASPWSPSERPFAAFGLSPEQQRAVREISLRHQPRLVTMQALAEAKRAELAELLAEPPGGDAGRVEACLREISRLEAERDLEVVANLRELKPHLTREQQIALFQYIQLRHATLERGP